MGHSQIKRSCQQTPSLTLTSFFFVIGKDETFALSLQYPKQAPTMSTNSMSTEAMLNTLDNVEKIAGCIQSAGQGLMELSKDKPSMKQVEGHTSQFTKTLSHVEAELSKHINYLSQVSTGQPHEGSAYGSQKRWKSAWHRLEHTRSRLHELENLKNRAIAANRSIQGQNNP